jgi:hypothetical protein
LQGMIAQMGAVDALCVRLAEAAKTRVAR